MLELLLVVVAALFSLYTKIITRRVSKSNTQIEIIEPQNSISEHTNLTANIIKDRLISIYNDNIPDKREQIVYLLIQLHEIEDTDVFFEKHDYIRSYIFEF